MKRTCILAVCLALAMFCQTATAQANDEMDRLVMQSAATEWVFANCDNDKLDSGFLLAAQAVLSQVGIAADRARILIADGTKTWYPDVATACAEMAWVGLPE